MPPKTCSCNTHKYLDIETNQCENCDQLCMDCFGPSSHECTSCDISFSYSVEDNPNLCVLSCFDLEGYYQSNYGCKSKIFTN